MKNKKILLLLGLSMMLTLSSCGKSTIETPAGDPQPVETVEGTAEVTPAPDTTAEPKEQTDTAPADTVTEAPETKVKYLFAGEAESGYDFSENYVANNGTHFVQVNDTVIFRSYGEHALDSSAFFGEFMTAGRSEPDYDYVQDSLLCAYTPSTDTYRELCGDDGTGLLFYADGWIWSDGMDQEFEDMQVYRIDPSSGKRENLGTGSLRYVTESGLGLIQSYGYDEAGEWGSSYMICDGKGSLTGIDFGDWKNPYFYAGGGDYLIFMNQDYDDDVYTILAVNTTAPGTVIELGTPPSGDEDDFSFAWPSIDQVVAEGDMIYMVIAYYGGSGGFWQGGYIAQADARTPGSVSKLVDDNISDDADIIGASSIWLEDGKLQIGAVRPEIASYSDYSGGILLSDNAGTYEELGIDLTADYPEGTAVSEMIEEIAYLEGGFFVVHNTCLMDAAQNVGWREAYHRLSTRYEFVKPDGTVKILNEVDRKVILSAHVALDGDGKGLYIQPIFYTGEEESELDITESYDYFLGELAQENVVANYDEAMFSDEPPLYPLEKLNDFEKMLVITDPEPDTWYGGYYVSSTGKDRLSNVAFIVQFNSDGKIIMVFPDYAG